MDPFTGVVSASKAWALRRWGSPRARRFTLFLVWLAGLALSSLGSLSVALQAETPEVAERALGALQETLGLFAPYLTPMTAFWFKGEDLRQIQPRSTYVFLVAIACSALYVAIMISVCRHITLGVSVEAIEQTMNVAIKLAAGLAFLVGPAVGAYFLVNEDSPPDSTVVASGEPERPVAATSA